jgi:hypothetical protein
VFYVSKKYFCLEPMLIFCDFVLSSVKLHPHYNTKRKSPIKHLAKGKIKSPVNHFPLPKRVKIYRSTYPNLKFYTNPLMYSSTFILQFAILPILLTMFSLYNHVLYYQKCSHHYKILSPRTAYFLACVHFSKTISVLKTRGVSAEAKDGMALLLWHV